MTDNRLPTTDTYFMRPLLIIALLGLALRILFAALMPLYPDPGVLPGYNDEPLHLHYVEYLVREHEWPVWGLSELDTTRLSGEFVQPPLYYLLAAQGYRVAEWLGMEGRLGARAVSVLFGMLAALFTLGIVRRWRRDELPTATAAFTAMVLAPTALVFTSIVTNDSLLICLAAMFFHSLLTLRESEYRPVREIMTGALLACAVWAKMSALALYPLIWWAHSREAGSSDAWWSRGRVAIVAVTMVLPLIGWNLAHYGRIIPFVPGYAPEDVIGMSGGALYHPFWAVRIWLRSAALPFDVLWGPLLEKIISLVWVAIWGGLAVVGMWNNLRWRMLEGRAGGLFVAAVVLVTAAFACHNVEMFQVEFRLLAPAFPALAILTGSAAARAGLPAGVQAALWLAPLVLLI